MVPPTPITVPFTPAQLAHLYLLTLDKRNHLAEICPDEDNEVAYDLLKIFNLNEECFRKLEPSFNKFVSGYSTLGQAESVAPGADETLRPGNLRRGPLAGKDWR